MEKTANALCGNDGLGFVRSCVEIYKRCLYTILSVWPKLVGTNSLSAVTSDNRVATNLENLEYSGISLNIENSGNFHGILCNLREKL